MIRNASSDSIDETQERCSNEEIDAENYKKPVSEINTMFIGVDGCTDGWVAVIYDGEDYVETTLYSDINDLWNERGDTDVTILIDIPIGLRENSDAKRPCDDAARRVLSPHRHSSVFPVPVREAVHKDTYEEAKEVQENRTDGSLGVQSWNIADKIAELDTFFRKTEPSAVGIIREAHPEVCFWALNEKTATEYSKTQQPAAAFWERVAILDKIDSEILGHIGEGGTGLDAKVGNDDLVDAFALALTASPKTGQLRTLPADQPADDDCDPTNLPMEMVYAHR